MYSPSDPFADSETGSWYMSTATALDFSEGWDWWRGGGGAYQKAVGHPHSVSPVNEGGHFVDSLLSTQSQPCGSPQESRSVKAEGVVGFFRFWPAWLVDQLRLKIRPCLLVLHLQPAPILL